jgi:hypothetical protein
MHYHVCLLSQLLPIVCLVRLAIIPIVIGNPILHELLGEGLLTIQLDLLMQVLNGLFYALSGLQSPSIDGRSNQLAWRLLVGRD